MRFLRDNGLTLALAAAFLVSLAGMMLAGWADENAELARHSLPAIGFVAYIVSGSFLSALFENWESEFLQMAAYVIFTAYLFQRGSAESTDPDEPPRPRDELPKVWKDRAPVFGWLYSHSLGIALALLFVFSFVAHWLSSVSAANEEAATHGGPHLSALQYLGDARFWFESFQNWQSEFLSTAVLVVLSIFLRFKGSPESKPVAAPHGETGAS
jgi:hypothetical protein